MHWKATKLTTRAAGALAALFLFTSAHANTIDFEPVVGTIEGSQTFVFEFDIVATGLYRALLTDLESPAPFQVLGLGIATVDGEILVQDFRDGQIELDFTVDPGRYLALVGGLADADTNIGTFGLEISNVPVPGVGLLMMSALTTLGFFMRRR